MISFEFKEGFGLCRLWLDNKALINQLVGSIPENFRTLVFRADLTPFGSYFKTVVRIFSRLDLTIDQ